MIIRKIFNHMSVKGKIILVVVAATLVATIAVVSIQINQLTNQVDQQLLERLQDTTYSTIAIFDAVRLNMMGMLETVANTPMVLRSFSDGPDEDLKEFMYVFLYSMSQTENGVSTLANIVLYDRNFTPVLSAVPDGEVPTMLDFPSNFLTAQMGQSMSSSAVQSPRTGLVQFLFTAPIMIEGQVEGVAAILVNTQMLELFLRDDARQNDGFVNIADRDGNIFFSNRPEYVGRHIGELGVVEAFGYLPTGRLFHHESAITGVEKIAYISIDIPLGWTIVSFFDAHAVDNVVLLIITTLVPSLTGIAFSTIVILLIVHYSLKPLGTLATSANEISKGNMGAAFHVDRNDEIGQVGYAFIEIVRVLNILRSNFKKAEDAVAHGETEYSLFDSRLSGIYDEMLTSTSNIVEQMKQAKTDAENSSKAKSDFLSKMSHEIRTPMNAIIGMAELILREELSSTARDQATTIKQSGDHLLCIINDILDLSKVESGKLELVNADYFFHSTVHDVINVIKMRMSNPDVRFAAYVQHDIPNHLFGDEVRVRQILLNVLTNALKYTVKGHFSLDITAEKASGNTVNLIIRTKDTGIGIKPENMDKLFGEFTQFDLEKNKNIEGTGLGLAITKNLVKLMGGTIEVESTYGEGTEFIITLPQECKADENEAPSFADKSVLVYCRSPLNTKYIELALADLKTEYHIVRDDKDLRERLSQTKWDFVFTEADLAANTITGNDGTKTVILADSYDSTYDVLGGHDFSLLVMPAYFISIANVLSGGDISYSESNQQSVFFHAPDAKVLIVDDIETNLRVGKGLLSVYGMAVDTCASGKEAIETVLSNDYDLVFMDHMMPEMDGLETTRIIRSFGGKYTGLPVIALTANAIVGVREIFLQNGLNDFLSKPIEVGKLNNILTKWIPKEKQKPAEAAATQAEEKTVVIAGVDTARGIHLSGGTTQNYFEILKIFHRDCQNKLTQLAQCVENNDSSLYTTYVHALKSASANIGAGELSEKAKIMEDAGIRQDMGYIKKHNADFLSSVEMLLGEIGEVLAANAENAAGDLDIDEMKSLIAALRTAAENLDFAAIEPLYERLQPFTDLPVIGDALRDVLESVFLSNYKHAVTQIDGLDFSGL